MSRATPLFLLACLALAAGCSDQPMTTAPSRPNLTIAANPAPQTYTVSVDSVTLEGLPGSTYNIAYGVNRLGDAVGVGSHAVRWPTGSTVPNDVGIGEPHDINDVGQLAGEFGLHAELWTPDGTGGYTLTNIGSGIPGAVWSTAWSINKTGQVVGYYQIVPKEGVSVFKCFLWTPDRPNATTGTVTTLVDFGGDFCVANDVNSSGYIVGAATTPDGQSHAFIMTPITAGRLAKIQDLTPSGSGYATSINDVRQVAGQHAGNATIWTPSVGGSYTLTHLGTFTGDESFALDINDAGFVVGYARRNSGTGGDDAFFWQGGEFALLPAATSISEATALTAFNGNTVQVVGGSLDNATGTRKALRWTVTLTPPGPSPQ